jgi:hypothetical protein
MTMTGVRGPEDNSVSLCYLIVFAIQLPNDPVPILDARGKTLNLPENAKKIIDTFPRFSGSIPKDSVVLVCYTTSKYEKNSNIFASFNILWAAVLCGNDASVLSHLNPCAVMLI